MMNDSQKTLAEAAKIMTNLTQKNRRLENEIADLKNQVARWQNAFLAFAESHFPENTMQKRHSKNIDDDLSCEIIEDDDNITIIRKNCDRRR